MTGLHTLARGQRQQGLELFAEEGTAVAASAGEVEGEGGQRIEHPEGAHVAPVEGLHPDHRHHHLGRHTPAGVRALEPARMRAPEAQAGVDACTVDEARAVGRPVLGRARWRGHDEPLHGGQPARQGELRLHPLELESAALRDVLREGHHVGACAVGGLRRGCPSSSRSSGWRRSALALTLLRSGSGSGGPGLGRRRHPAAGLRRGGPCRAARPPGQQAGSQQRAQGGCGDRGTMQELHGCGLRAPRAAATNCAHHCGGGLGVRVAAPAPACAVAGA